MNKNKKIGNEYVCIQIKRNINQDDYIFAQVKFYLFRVLSRNESEALVGDLNQVTSSKRKLK